MTDVRVRAPREKRLSRLPRIGVAGWLMGPEDAHDLPAGRSKATHQVNAQSGRPGELRARPGVDVVRFD
jgi:hypothetical protein